MDERKGGGGTGPRSRYNSQAAAPRAASSAYDDEGDEGDEIYEEAQLRGDLRGREKAQSWVGKEVRNTGGRANATRAN